MAHVKDERSPAEAAAADPQPHDRMQENLELGVAMAEAEALWQLRMKMKQVASPQQQGWTPTAEDYALMNELLRDALARRAKAKAAAQAGTDLPQTGDAELNVLEMVLTQSEHTSIRDNVRDALERARKSPRQEQNKAPGSHD
jgi:hypothetical protein